VAGWIHYLAFDLFIGAWIVEDALSRGVPAWLSIGVLPFTFMFGPHGSATLSGRSYGVWDRTGRTHRRMSGVLDELRRRNAPMTALAVMHLAMLAVFRTSLARWTTHSSSAINRWIKPAKFAVSIAIYLATIAWLLPDTGVVDRAPLARGGHHRRHADVRDAGHRPAGGTRHHRRITTSPPRSMRRFSAAWGRRFL
jgi:hypothetical protein